MAQRSNLDDISVAAERSQRGVERMQLDDLSQIHPVILFSIAVMTVAALHYIIRYPRFLSRRLGSHRHSFCQKKNAILMHLRKFCSLGYGILEGLGCGMVFSKLTLRVSGCAVSFSQQQKRARFHLRGH